MQTFKERVEDRAKDRIEIRLFPANQLGSIARQIEGMQLGTVEGWIGPPSFLTGVDPRFQVVDATGLFKDWAHAQRAVTDPSFRDYFLGLGEDKGIKGLGHYVSNPMAVVSRKGPVRTVEDFRGLKFRVLGSAIEIELMKRLGAAGVPMDLSEALPAIQRGAIDAMRTGIVIFVPFKYWTINKYMTEVGEAMIIAAAFVSKKWWDTLPKDLQQIMLEEAKKLDDENYKYALNQYKTFRGIWTKNGGEIIDLAGAERAKIMDLVRPVGAAVAAGNPAVKDAYDRLVAAVKKTEK
jgi:TRAP-type C4-dicarboxylate transport system substrate-binding protein